MRTTRQGLLRYLTAVLVMCGMGLIFAGSVGVRYLEVQVASAQVDAALSVGFILSIVLGVAIVPVVRSAEAPTSRTVAATSPALPRTIKPPPSA